MKKETGNMEFTGERYVPEERGNIELEHIHRYLQAGEISAGKVVLDLACGEGYGSSLLANRAEKVIGVDISPEAVVHARKRYKKENLEFREGNCANIPLPDASVDLVVSFETIEHHGQHEEMMQEIKRVLRPSGILLISSPDKHHYSVKPDYSNPYHIKELYLHEFKQLLENYFKHTALYGQRVIYGSGIFAVSLSTPVQSYVQEHDRVEEFAGMPRPNYWIALASDEHLPDLASGILEQPINDAEIIQSWRSVVAERDRTIVEQGEQIAGLRQVVAERDADLVSSSRIVAERNRHITLLNEDSVRRGEWALGLERQLQDANATIAGILSSTSWRMTAPLRAAKSLLGFTPNDGQHKISFPLRFIRMVYHLAPLGDNKKERLQDIFYARFPGVFKSLKSYEAWVKRRNYRGGIVSPPKDTFVIPRAWVAETIIAPDDIRLSASDKPLVSVVIPAYGQVKFTLQCLNSIANNPPQIPFEVIVIDDSSPDNSREMLGKVSGIRLFSNEKNSGFIRSCNKGASEARGEYLCFLNNDTVVSPGWLEELVRTYEEFPGTGLAGSKLVYPDGTLQEAGGIIWRDGSAWNFGHGQDPSFPIFNYAREVDYCSGASIMVPKRLFDELGGFDELYAPAYCEDCDLALKVRARGLSVIYQPHSVVTHFEGITSGTDLKSGTKAYQINNTKKLFKRWKDHLANHQKPGQDVDSAKDRLATHRVLVLDHCTPTPDQDAGSIVAFNIMLLLRQTGFQVTFIPEDNFLYMPRYTADLQRVGIEALYAPYFTSINQHLVESGSRYDLVLIFRPSVMDTHIKNIRKLCPRAKVLFHTVDLHYVRMQREADPIKDQKSIEAAERMKSMELKVIGQADATIVVSTSEKEVLDRQLPQSNVFIFPLILDIRGTDKTFQERRDIVFVGGYQHLPNVDAVKYFVSNVMPILRRRLPGVQFFVVGSKPPVEIQALAAEDVIIAGFVQDLYSLLDKMRVSVAPLRYGAGIKGKIGTAMACGLPSVATTLAVEGMSLMHGNNILVTDTDEEIANSVIQLYEDEALWNKIASNGIEFAEKTWGAEAAWKVLDLILKDLGIVSTRRNRLLILHH